MRRCFRRGGKTTSPPCLRRSLANGERRTAPLQCSAAKQTAQWACNADVWTFAAATAASRRRKARARAFAVAAQSGAHPQASWRQVRPASVCLLRKCATSVAQAVQGRRSRRQPSPRSRCVPSCFRPQLPQHSALTMLQPGSELTDGQTPPWSQAFDCGQSAAAIDERSDECAH